MVKQRRRQQAARPARRQAVLADAGSTPVTEAAAVAPPFLERQ
jgi:hypothetical protein